MDKRILTFIKSKGFDFIPDPCSEGYQEFKSATKKGWYVLNTGKLKSGKFYTNLIFCDWNEKVQYQYTTQEDMTPEELKEFESLAKQERESLDSTLEKKREQVSELINNNWPNTIHEPDLQHGYLLKKKVDVVAPAKLVTTMSGQKEVRIPLIDIDNKLWNIQTINEDGFKRGFEGGKIQGCFCVLNKNTESNNIPAFTSGDTIVLCEGYSTGVSIHTAMAYYSVVVCINAKNVGTVAGILRRRFPRTPILVAGDDDQWTEGNAGRISAEETADLVWGTYVLPTFQDDSLEKRPTDFNDLHSLEGIEEVTKQLKAAPSKRPPYLITLGYFEDGCYITTSENKFVRHVKEFRKMELLNLLPYEYWERMYPKVNQKGITYDIDLTAVCDDITQRCRKRGVFNSKKLRGRGMWMDQGRHIFHLGDRLLVDGVSCDLQDLEKSDYVYEIGHRIPLPIQKQVDFSDFEAISGVLKKFAWDMPHYHKLFLGGLVSALASGALEWRPHIWITAEAGTGKSTLMNHIICPLFDAVEGFTAVNTTEAGLRQAMRSDALPVALDEFDTSSTHKKKMEAVLDLLRAASSGGTVNRGTSGGIGQKYTACFSAILAGINIPTLNKADQTRITILELRKNKKWGSWPELESELTRVFTKELFQQIVWTVYCRLKNLGPSIKIFMRVIEEKFGDARLAQQAGALLAGYWLLQADEVVSLEKAEEITADWVEKEVELEEDFGVEETDAQQCWEYMKSIVVGEVGERDERAKITLEGALIEYGTGANKWLAQFGMQVLAIGYKKSGNERLFIKKTNKQLKHAMKDSVWHGDWCKTLERLPNASKHRTSSGNGCLIECDIKVSEF